MNIDIDIIIILCTHVQLCGQLQGYIAAGIPYGLLFNMAPVSFQADPATGNYTLSNNTWVEPIFSFFPSRYRQREKKLREKQHSSLAL